jgi:WD40 repeat protein
MSVKFLFWLLGAIMIASAAQAGNVIGLDKLQALSLAPDNSVVIGAGWVDRRGAIHLWRVADGSLIESVLLEPGEWVEAMAMSPNGDFLAVSLLKSADIACYSPKDKRWIWRVKWPEKNVIENSIRFSPDNERIVILGHKIIVLYDAKTGNVVRRIDNKEGFSAGHSASATRIGTLSPSGKYAAFWQGHLEHNEWIFVTLLRSKWVVVWDIEKEKIISDWEKTFTKYKNCSAAFSPDEKSLMIGSMDGYVRQWSIKEQRMIREWKPFHFVNSLVYSPKGYFLAMMGSDRGVKVKIWDLDAQKELKVFDNIRGNYGVCDPYPMAFSNDETLFALEEKGMLCIYDTTRWNKKWCIPL